MQTGMIVPQELQLYDEDCDPKLYFRYYVWPLQKIEVNGLLKDHPVQKIFLFRDQSADVKYAKEQRMLIGWKSLDKHVPKYDRIYEIADNKNIKTKKALFTEFCQEYLTKQEAKLTKTTASAQPFGQTSSQTPKNQSAIVQVYGQTPQGGDELVQYIIENGMGESELKVQEYLSL